MVLTLACIGRDPFFDTWCPKNSREDTPKRHFFKANYKS